MRDLRKVVPPSREILKGIYLSFFPGAKIGVLGANGAGKSIAAPHHGGRGQGLPGRRAPAAGHPDRLPAAGAAARSRRRTCAATSMEGVREQQAHARPVQRDQRPVRRADGRRRDDPAAREAGQSAGADRRARPLGARPQDRSRDGRAAAPAGRRRRRQDLRRRAAPRGALPAAAGAAGHAAARRAHQPPRRRERVVAGALPRASSRAPSSPSPTTATSSTTWPAGFSSCTRAPGFPGRGTTPPGWSRRSGGWRQEEKQASARQKTLQRELEWVRMSPRARQAKSKARITRYEELREESRAADRGQRRDPDSGARRGWATRSWSRTTSAKGFGDRLLFENLNFALPRGGIVGVIGPNGAGKTTLFRMITGQEQPDAGTLKVGSTVQIAYVDQSRDALDPEQDRVPGDHRRAGPAPVRHAARSTRGPTPRASTSAAPTSRRRSAPSPAASATGCTWPSCSRAAATCCCSTSRPTTSTWTRSGRWRRRCSASPAAPW